MRRLLLVVVVVVALGTATVVTMPSTQPQPVEPASLVSESSTTTPPAVAERASNTESSPAAVKPAPSRDAQVAQLYADCVADTQTPFGQVAAGGEGRPVAVIGDSITTQIRERLTADPSHHWVVWSRCGATVQTALDAGAVTLVQAENPDVVVVALGTNDAGFPSPVPGSSAGFEGRARQLLNQLAWVPCVAWVTAGQVGDPVLQAEIDRVNALVRATGVRVVDWGHEVESDPGLLLDHVHLSRDGTDRRWQLTVDAANGC